jgi:hypothetical protein
MEDQQTNGMEPPQSAMVPKVVREMASPHGALDPDPIAIIEQRNRAMERLLEYAVCATRPEHWTDQGGKPYLTSAGAQAVARRCGVKVTDVVERKEKHRDQDGDYYEFVYTATFSLPGAFDKIEGVSGSCTSKDPLLGTGTSRLISEVDPGDIRKKAYTNLLQRGITMLLGLRGLEWSSLKRFNVTPEGATKVEYQTGARGGGGAGEEFSFKFGKQKSIPISKLSEEDLGWYLKISKEDAASTDPKKSKYKANSEKQVKVIEEELARRKNAASGTTPAPAANVSMRQRIDALARDNNVPEDMLGPLVKKATGKSKPSDMNEDDVKKIAASFAHVAASNSGDDIDF